MFIIKVCQALVKAQVPYAIVGGYAVALHGAVRGTVDVDLVLAWTLENLEKAEKSFKEIGLVSRLPVNAADIFKDRDDYIQKRNLIAWNFYNPSNPIEQVDLLINYDLTKATVDHIQTPFGEVNVLSRADLITMKKASGRPQDLEDIKALGNL